MSSSTTEKVADNNLSQQISDLQIDEARLAAVRARIDKKVNMTLDDLIKMSRKNEARLQKQRRDSIRKRSFAKINSLNANSKPQQYADSRSSIRKGVPAPRRSNFYGHFSYLRDTAIGYSAVPKPNTSMGSSTVRGEGRRLREPYLQLKANGGRPFSMKQGDNKPVIRRNLRMLDALFASIKDERKPFTRGARVHPAPPAVAPNATSGGTTRGKPFATSSSRFGGGGGGRCGSSSQWRPLRQ